MNKLNTLLHKLKSDLIEHYTLLLLVIGLPFIAYIYSDWRAAISVAILSQIILGILIVMRTK